MRPLRVELETRLTAKGKRPLGPGDVMGSASAMRGLRKKEAASLRTPPPLTRPQIFRSALLVVEALAKLLHGHGGISKFEVALR